MSPVSSRPASSNPASRGAVTSYRLAYTDSPFAAFRPRGAAARWNSEGVVVVYTAEHPALAAMEILAGWEAYVSLSGYFLFRCRFDAAGVEDVLETVTRDGPAELDLHDKRLTRALGDAWVRERRSVALRVPSVVVPEGRNYLLNPSHPQFAATVAIAPLGRFAFDPRVDRLLQLAREKSG